MRPLLISSGIAALLLAGVAQAHPKLVSASPAAHATVSKLARVELRFSEKLMPAFSKADLIIADANGRPSAKVASAAAVAPDGRSLVVTPRAPLRPGRYNVAWRVVSADTHRVAGNYGFAIK